MGKLSKPWIFGLFLALISLAPLHAQTPANASPDTNTANPAPTAQAPDDVTNKITGLVHAGKYAEAQQLTTGLLVAYPNDQRLIKARTLLDKLLANPADNQSNNAASAPSPNPDQLAGMEKVDYNALIALARQAQQTTDLTQQNASLKQFMDESRTFLQKHPHQTVLWELRAATAISLNQPMEGYDAGQQLLASGAADSNDPAMQSLLGQLKNKGWLDQHQAEALQITADNDRRQQQAAAEAERKKAESDKYTFPVAHARSFGYGFGHLTMSENDGVYVDSGETIRFSKNDLREMKTMCLAKNMCGFYFIPKDGKRLFFLAVTEDAVASRTLADKVFLPPSVLGNAAVERWHFVNINNTTLGPSPGLQGSAR
jgi:hypothetical protein